MSTISASTTSTTAFKITTDTTGALVFQTGSSPTTALTLGSDQSVTFAGAVTASGNQTVTGNLTVNGNTTVGDASTDTATVNATTTFVAYPNLPNTFGFKNRIINGAMVIDQRNAGASVSRGATDNVYTLDRWNTRAEAADGVYTVQRVADAPAGFVNSLKVTITTADASVGASQVYAVNQTIEGYNVADLSFGSANAKTITVSFWVKSTLTGSFGASITNGSGSNRSYPFLYTISSANTWEYKTVTIAGDQSGTWTTDSTGGMMVNFAIGTGSSEQGTVNTWNAGLYRGATGQTQVISTLNATIQWTGVQLEKGSTATSFDYRPYGTELQLCQRYYSSNFNVGVAPSQGGSSDNRPCIGTIFNSTYVQSSEISFPVPMRATPSITFYRPSFISTDGSWGIYPMHWGGGGFVAETASATYLRLVVGGSSISGGTNYNSYIMSGYFAASAEL